MSSPRPHNTEKQLQAGEGPPPRLERLFFALWPDDALRQTLKRQCKELIRHSGGRPVALENLHITLAFLGSVDGAQRRCVEQAAAAIALPRFTLTLDQVGHWSRPRVLWLGARETPDTAKQLASQLARGCRDCGLSLDRRPFVAHLTLKRKVREAPPPMELKPIEWSVDQFALVKSHTLPEGVQYEVVGQWPLRVED
jgi:2'-5' RNA ligase